MAGLFDTFTVAKRGLNVQQGAINTTSHNIANANTVGYSRQRAVIETTRPFGGMSRFDSCSAGQVGTGAQITTIMRIRDSFIDYQVRNETGKLGNYEVLGKFLSQVEDVFGEPSDKGIQKLFSEFYASFQELAKTPDKSSARTVALQKAAALADALNHTYTQLEKKVTDAQDLLQQNVTDVNSILDQINELNQQISQVCAVGQTPNDLMDKRDNLLDQLSKSMGITIDKDIRETINLKVDGFPADGESIDNLVNSKPNTDYSRFSYVKGVDYGKNSDGSINKGKIVVEYYPLGDSKVTKTVEITAEATADKTAEQVAEELKANLEQNRILVGDTNGNVILKDTNGNSKVETESGTITTVKSGEYTVVKTNDVITCVKDNKGNKLEKLGDKWGTYTEKPDGTKEFNEVTLGNEKFDDSKIDLRKSIFQIYKPDDNNSIDLKNVKGEIAGNQSSQNMMKDYMNDLDRIAAALAYSVNAIQTGSDGTTPVGTDYKGDPYELVFLNCDKTNSDAGITAKNITVNDALIKDVSKLNCNSTNNAGEKNGDRAQAIANLLTTKINMSELKNISLLTREDFFNNENTGLTFTDGINVKGNTSGKTIDSYYKDVISELGTKTQEAIRRAETQSESILKNLEMQRLSVSGVSLDEEMSNLIQFQHSYSANAKMISTIDELLDVVINGLKR